jgi:hypothetical protein
VVSFSDPIARTTLKGKIIHRGHFGICYQATSATFLGRTEPRSLRLLPDGTVLNGRALQKIRSGEQGWQYAAALLEAFGAGPPPVQERAEWLKVWLPRVTRPLRHSGNYKYAWAVGAAGRRFLPASLPYPKPRGFPNGSPVSSVRINLDSQP